MSSGYGGSGWGIGPWGGSDGASSQIEDTFVNEVLEVLDSVVISIPLRVVQAFAPDSFGVIVTFSNDLNISYPPLIDPSNYSIPGLTVTGAAIINSTQILLTTTEQEAILYTLTVAEAESINGDPLGVDDNANFFGTLAIPTFIAGAESSTKVELVFTAAMSIDAAFLNPANYTITRAIGSAPVTVLSVTASGDDPLRRATLILGTALVSKEYYAVVVSPAVESVAGLSVDPDTYVFQWADMREPVRGRPLEIPIKDFSGEVTSGLLGQPDGQVFFSPALEAPVSSDSTIELEELSVCTRAYDEYHFPVIPDPLPLMTYGPRVAAVLSTAFVLWAPADRLGQAQINQRALNRDAVYSPVYDPASGTLQSPISDTPAVGTLKETIDTTKAAFLNDVRWKTFPNSGALVFRTADNLSSIGPGPTSTVKLSRLPRLDVRGLLDSLPTTDVAYVNTSLVDLTTDSVAVSDQATREIL